MAFTNSPLVTYTNLTKNKTTNRNHEIDTITIHCYVGQVTAKQGCDYFATTNRQCSANYVVGHDGSIGLSVEEKNRAWTSGGVDKNGNAIKVNGISGADNDHRAVTIEVACDAKAPYTVTSAAYDALIKLIADICKRNNIKELKWKGDKSLVGQVDKQNMTVHRWFAATECPGDHLYKKHSDIAAKVNALLKPKKTTTTKAKFAKGDKVKVKKAVTYDGKAFKTYYDVYDVLDVKDDRVVIGIGKTITAAVKATNLTAVKQTTTTTSVKKTIKVGSTVKVKKGAKTFNGGSLASFVYERNHKVKEINVDRVVITYNGSIVAAVRKSDLTVID